MIRSIIAMNLPCLDFEYNKAWFFSQKTGDIDRYLIFVVILDMVKLVYMVPGVYVPSS